MFNFTVFVCALAAAVAIVAIATGASFVFIIPAVAAPALFALTFGMAMLDSDGPERPAEYEWRRW